MSPGPAQETPPASTRGARPDHESLPPRLYRRVQVLCVGINHSASTGFPRLEWAERDAESLARLFTQHYDYQVETLYGAEATRSAIFGRLEEYRQGRKNEQGEWTLSPLSESDALIVFFAGHGHTLDVPEYGRRGFLLPQDVKLDPREPSNVDSWRAQAIDMADLARLLESLPARHVLVLADACYSGFLGKRSGASGRVDLTKLARQRSRMVMTAGTEEQEALEFPHLRHGVFSDALLRELQANQAHSVREVFVRVRDKVASESQGRMLPQLRELVVDNGEFVFLPKQVTSTDVPGVLRDLNRRLNAAVAQATTIEEVYLAAEVHNYRFAIQAPRLQQQWEQRVARLRENATLGDALAMAALFYCYSRGLGVEPDWQLAFHWAREAHDTQHPVGRHVLGVAYEQGIGVSSNPLAGRRLIEEAAADGLVLSRYSVAYQRYHEPGSRGDDSAQREFRENVEAAAHAGVLSARHRYGVMLVRGEEGLEPAPERGLKLLQDAAQAGFAEAAYSLATIYGEGVTPEGAPDEAEQERWLEQAAAAGLPSAQWERARQLLPPRDQPRGRGRTTEALQLAEAAHRQGLAKATLLLGRLYDDGKWVTPDKSHALELVEKAADKDDAEAEYLLAQWYWNGHGRHVPPDHAKAAELGEEAGRHGCADGWSIACHFQLEVSRRRDAKQAERLQRAAQYCLRGLHGGSELVLPALVQGPRGSIGDDPSMVSLADVTGLFDLRKRARPRSVEQEWREVLREEKRRLGEEWRKESVGTDPAPLPRVGLALVDTNSCPWLAHRLGLTQPAVIVTLVYPRTPAAEAGLLEFDVVTHVADQPVRRVSQAQRWLADRIAHGPCELQVRRLDEHRISTEHRLSVDAPSETTASTR